MTILLGILFTTKAQKHKEARREPVPRSLESSRVTWCRLESWGLGGEKKFSKLSLGRLRN